MERCPNMTAAEMPATAESPTSEIGPSVWPTQSGSRRKGERPSSPSCSDSPDDKEGAMSDQISQAGASSKEGEQHEKTKVEEKNSRSTDSQATEKQEKHNENFPADLEQRLKEMRHDRKSSRDDGTSIMEHIVLSRKASRAVVDEHKTDFHAEEQDEEGENQDNEDDGKDPASLGQEESVPHMTDEQKLDAIVEEFGPTPIIAGIHGKERIIASEPAVLVRRVVVRGYLVMTTHRICFIALLTSSPPSTEALWQGPATIHQCKFVMKKRKAWVKLTSESLTAYPSSTELYEPIGGIRLTRISCVQPDLDHNAVRFCVAGKKYAMEFETKEAALAWQREIDAAIWKHTHDFEKIRVSIPLVRITSAIVSDYMGFSTLVSLDVLDIDQPGHRHPNLHRHAHDPHSTIPVSFAVLRESVTIPDEIKNKVSEMEKVREKYEESDWWKLPSAVIDIDGSQRSEAEAAASLDEKDKSGSLIKKQRAMMLLFALECKPEEISVFSAHLSGSFAFRGTLAISPNYLSFSCKHKLSGLPDTRIRIPIVDVTESRPEKAFFWHLYGARISVRAHEDVIFDMFTAEERDRLLDAIKSAKDKAPTVSEEGDKSMAEKSDQKVRHSKAGILAMQAGDGNVISSPALINYVPRAINSGPERKLRVAPMRIHCLTIGSRGDVQPYLALCKALQKHGHTTTIVSHDEYKEWVEGFGIDFRPVGGDPGELMKLSVDNSFFSPQFYREAMAKFRHWLDELLRGIMEQCWDADLIIESPSTFGGIHVAEAIDCYYMRAFTMPWTKTSEYPQAFSVPSVELGPQYNAMTYNLFDQILWMASSGQINRWRKHMLHLKPTDLAKLNQGDVPFMYNFSPAVVPPPLDWGDRIRITGYWNLPSADSSFDPPKDLQEFMKKAKDEDKKLCYIGFGSITMSDPRGVQEAIYKAVEKSDVRAIVSRGWSARMSKDGGSTDEGKEELKEPSSVYVVDSIPHDWLFPRIDFAMHHGGAGTTGASLQNGLVTMIHPFFGDQFFWSQRVAKLGAGVRVKSLSTDDIAEALLKVRDDRIMREKAQRVGEEIRKERGTEVAIDFIYHNLSRSQRKRRPLPVSGSDRPKRSLSWRKSSAKSTSSPFGESFGENQEKNEANGSPNTRRQLVKEPSNISEGGKEDEAEPLGRQDSLSLFTRMAKGPSKLFRKATAQLKRNPSLTEKRPERKSSESEARKMSREGEDDISSDEDEHTPQDFRDILDQNLPPNRRASWYSQNLHMPSFGKAQISMPHVHILSLPIMRLTGRSNGNKDKEDDGDESEAEQPKLSEAEQRRIKQEDAREHLSARDEDKRRRRMLEEVWRKNGREDLIKGKERVIDTCQIAFTPDDKKEP